MKFKDKFGNDVECSVKEYRVLMGLVHEDDDEPVETPKPEPKVTVVPMAFPVKGAGKQSEGSSGKKWSRKDLRYLRKNSDKPIDFLMRMFPNRSAGAILVKLKKVCKKRRGSPSTATAWTPQDLKIVKDNLADVSKAIILLRDRHSAGSVNVTASRLRKSLGVRVVKQVHNKFTDAELNILSIHRDDSLDALERLLPNHPRGSILDRLHKLYGRPKSDPARTRRKGKKDIYRKQDKETSKSVKRMKFINVRSLYYMNTFKWSRDKAFGQACVDWRNGKTTIGKVSSDDGMVYKVVEFDFASQKYNVLKVFDDEDDAKKFLAERKIADKTINGGSQFSIVKVAKGDKDEGKQVGK